jgi:hypothetical protein
MNWMALIIGFVFILCLGLLMQLGFIMVSVEYVELSKGHASLAPYKGLFFQLSVLVSFFLTLITGGYLTAWMAGKKPMLHASVAGGIASLLSLLFSRNIGELTLYSPMFLVFGISFALLGGWLRTKTERKVVI